MAADNNNLDVALRIKAEAGQANAALQQVQTQLDKTGDAAKRASTGTQSLNEATATTEKAVKAATAAEKAGVAQLEATNAAAKTAATNAQALGRNLGSAVNNVVRGNLGGAAKDVGSLAVASARAGGALAGLGVAFAAAAVAVGVAIVAFVKGQQETDKFNQALIATGDSAAATAGQLVGMANRVGATTGRYGDAVQALTALANTGKYSRNQLDQLTETAVEFATMTGGKVADGVKFVDGIMSGNIDTLTKLDQQYHFLSATQYDEILRLQAQGETERATAIAQQAASKAVRDRAEEVKASAGIIERAWNGVKSAASDAWNTMKGIGAAKSIGDQLTDAVADLSNARGTHRNRAGDLVQNASPETIAALQANVDNLRHLLAAQGVAQTNGGQWTDADGKVHNETGAVNTGAADRAKQAIADLDQYKTAIEKRDDDLAALDKKTREALLGPGLTAEDKALIRQHAQEAKDEIEKAYKAATRSSGGDDAGKAQLKAAAAAAHAQDELVQALVQIQATADPTAAAYARYNEQVANANKLADEAKKATGANVEAINAERDAVIAGANAELEAAKKKIEAQRLADQNKSIQGLLQKAPGAYRVPPEIGGAAGELLQLQKQLADLEAWHQKIMQANQAFRAEDTRNETQYLQNKAAIEQKYRTDKAAADAASQQLSLQAAQQAFGTLAGTMADLYGQQSVQYRAAFALEKSAALASTIVQLSNAEAAALASGSKINPLVGFSFMASIIAEGVSLIEAIRGASFDVGGYTGPGGKHQPAGIVHAGEVVWSQDDIARAGGVGIVEMMRLRGYADGGVVSAPTPASLGFRSQAMAPIRAGSVMVAPVEVVIHNQGGGQAQVKQSTGGNGKQLIEVFINAAAGDIVNNGKMAKAIEQRYMVKRKGQQYG